MILFERERLILELRFLLLSSSSGSDGGGGAADSGVGVLSPPKSGSSPAPSSLGTISSFGATEGRELLSDLLDDPGSSLKHLDELDYRVFNFR